MLAMSWFCLFILVLGSWMVSTWSFAWAVLAGGIISIASFYVSGHDVTAFVDSLCSNREDAAGKDDAKRTKKGFILKFWIRLLVIGVVLFFLIKSGGINVFGLILGLQR